MERSRKLILTNWTKANDALNLYFEGNKSKLAEHVRMSRTTVTGFFKPKLVREAEFRKLCLALRLNWQEVSTVRTSPLQPNNKTDPLQQVQEHCRQKILRLHSRMRLLSGKEIGVDQLYVDLWLLNRSPRTFQVSHDKLLRTFDLRNDRLGLGDRIKRNSGFEVANTASKLVILGKPGAGKTTFLKHLAMSWCNGQFQPGLIAVFIEFRRIRDQNWTLVDAIGKELGIESWEQIDKLLQNRNLSAEEKEKEKAKECREQVKALLKQGKLLMLVDGLDEVPTSDLRRNVQNQLQDIVENYPQSRLILTCRTQIIESIPIGCTLVEVADFSLEQVKQFVQKWFKASGHADAEALKCWKTFDNEVDKNPALKELTVTPVLLSLMCLVFQDEGEIPMKSIWLYEKGIKLLLVDGMKTSKLMAGNLGVKPIAN